jgi:hypothetical protein
MESYRAPARWRGAVDLGLVVALIFGILNMDPENHKEVARLQLGAKQTADIQKFLRHNVHIGIAVL